MQTNAIYGKQYHIFLLKYTRVLLEVGIFTQQPGKVLFSV